MISDGSNRPVNEWKLVRRRVPSTILTAANKGSSLLSSHSTQLSPSLFPRYSLCEESCRTLPTLHAIHLPGCVDRYASPVTCTPEICVFSTGKMGTDVRSYRPLCPMDHFPSLSQNNYFQTVLSSVRIAYNPHPFRTIGHVFPA